MTNLLKFKFEYEGRHIVEVLSSRTFKNMVYIISYSLFFKLLQQFLRFRFNFFISVDNIIIYYYRYYWFYTQERFCLELVPITSMFNYITHKNTVLLNTT